MKLYNTLSRQKEEFQPLATSKVSLYTCGPTVYDRLHIGNWSSYIRWDILARLLAINGYEVNRVINITDVGHLTSDSDEGEDKLEKSARRENKTAWEIAKLYTDDFMSGMQSLNLLPATIYAKATDHIPEQIELIKTLENKGYTYQIADGVYYDISKFPRYAEFARLDLADQKQTARGGTNPDKRAPQDFALWKFSPKDRKRDMEWDSPWGKGFPGWHLECSAMAMKYLGETIDIHTGGIDHIAVHHTNEIAQSEAATGKKFVNFWLHNSFLLVDDQKISKSLQNGISLGDIQAKGFTPMDFKLMVLQSHYRTQSRFSWGNLEAAKKRLASVYEIADLGWQIGSLSPRPDQSVNLTTSKDQITAALNDDLNTPLALSLLGGTIDSLKIAQFDPSTDLGSFIKFLDDIFGFDLKNQTDITDTQKKLIEDRATARKNSDWSQEKLIKESLVKQGLVLRDTPTGTVWVRAR